MKWNKTNYNEPFFCSSMAFPRNIATKGHKTCVVPHSFFNLKAQAQFITLHVSKPTHTCVTLSNQHPTAAVNSAKDKNTHAPRANEEKQVLSGSYFFCIHSSGAMKNPAPYFFSGTMMTSWGCGHRFWRVRIKEGTQGGIVWYFWSRVTLAATGWVEKLKNLLPLLLLKTLWSPGWKAKRFVNWGSRN